MSSTQGGTTTYLWTHRLLRREPFFRRPGEPDEIPLVVVHTHGATRRVAVDAVAADALIPLLFAGSLVEHLCFTGSIDLSRVLVAVRSKDCALVPVRSRAAALDEHAALAHAVFYRARRR